MEFTFHSQKGTIQIEKLKKVNTLNLIFNLRGFKAIKYYISRANTKMLNCYTQESQLLMSAAAGERAQPQWPLRGAKIHCCSVNAAVTHDAQTRCTCITSGSKVTSGT